MGADSEAWDAAGGGAGGRLSLEPWHAPSPCPGRGFEDKGSGTSLSETLAQKASPKVRQKACLWLLHPAL